MSMFLSLQTTTYDRDIDFVIITNTNKSCSLSIRAFSSS